MIIGKPSKGSSSIPSIGITQWTKYTIPYTAIQTNALINNYALVTLPAKTLFSSSILKHSQAFTGGSIASCVALVISYGGQDLNGSFNIFQAPSGNLYQLQDQRGNGGYTVGSDITTTQPVIVRFTATGGGQTLNNLTQGSLDLWFETVTLQ
jgi:hypothetical protein